MTTFYKKYVYVHVFGKSDLVKDRTIKNSYQKSSQMVEDDNLQMLQIQDEQVAICFVFGTATYKRINRTAFYNGNATQQQDEIQLFVDMLHSIQYKILLFGLNSIHVFKEMLHKNRTCI